jgi:hypothetical protein
MTILEIRFREALLEIWLGQIQKVRLLSHRGGLASRIVIVLRTIDLQEAGIDEIAIRAELGCPPIL